ncbi:MAG: N-acetylmuramoyl-L-alanine amidase [Holosporaceae bacterium]|nr:N-acetylmuramoyl-L-alanine amidase [Holosporaceae bacterium]
MQFFVPGTRTRTDEGLTGIGINSATTFEKKLPRSKTLMCEIREKTMPHPVSTLLFLYVVILQSSFGMYTLDGVPLVDKHVDNSMCRSGVMYRAWSDPETQARKPDSWNESEVQKYIIWHYTGGYTVGRAYRAFEQNGVSANFTIDNDGTTYLGVNPDWYIAYHAGVSAWYSHRNLNYYALGIEHVNLGYAEVFQSVPGFSDPIQIPGDGRYWFPFSREQTVATALLTGALQIRYRIPDWNVLTHSSVAIGRKSDPGPKFPYKVLAAEFSVGWFPLDPRQVTLDRFLNLERRDYFALITALGFVKRPRIDQPEIADSDFIRAFQYVYSSDNISGELDESTRISILQCYISMYGAVDRITGRQNGSFLEEHNRWALENPEKAVVFSEYF